MPAVLVAIPGWEQAQTPARDATAPLIRAIGNSVYLSWEKKTGAQEYSLFVARPDGVTNIIPLNTPDPIRDYDLLPRSAGSFLVIYSTPVQVVQVSVKGSAVLSKTAAMSGAHLFRLYPVPETHSQYCFYTALSSGNYALKACDTALTNAFFDLSRSLPIVLDMSAGNQGFFFPELVTKRSNFLLIFTKRTKDGNRRTDAVFFMRSKDAGRSWSQPAQLSDQGTDADWPSANLSPDGTTLLVSCMQTFPDNRFALMTFFSTNLGLSFDRLPHTNFSSFVYFPKTLIKDEGFRLIGYDRSRDNHSVIFVRDYNAISGNWSEPAWLSRTNINSYNYSLSIGPPGFGPVGTYLAWEDDTGSISFEKNDTSVETPVISSPDLDQDYENAVTTARIIWTAPADPSGIRSFAYTLDNDPDTQPDIENLGSGSRTQDLTDLVDGSWYFHLRTIDGSGNWSPTAVFHFVINSSPVRPPVISSITHPEYAPVQNNSPLFTWHMTNERHRITGYSYLFTQNDGLEPQEKINTQATNMSFKSLPTGIWYFYLRACDRNNRWSPYIQYTVNIQETVLASKETVFNRIEPQEAMADEENQSAVTYTVKRGDILSRIIKKLLGMKDDEDFKDYLKEVSTFNTLQNPDLIRPDDKVMVPVLIAKKDTDRESIAATIFGNARYKNRVILHNDSSSETIRTGDKIVIRDQYFIKYGKLRSSSRMKTTQSLTTNGIWSQTNTLGPPSPEP
jgi:hypothetical protein